ncbi:MAG: tetratricopeptide repeat protein [Candidatus Acidoferrales bacterium]
MRFYALVDVVSVLGEVGDLLAARQVAEEIEDPQERGFALTHLAEALSEAGEREGAGLLLVEAFPLLSRQQGWQISIAGKLAELGNLEKALDYAAALKWNFARADAFSRIGEVLSRAGKHEQARELFEQAIEYILTPEGVKSLFWGPEDLLRLIARNGQSSTALNAVTRFEPGLERAQMLMGIAAGQALAGETNAALATLQLAEDELGRARATLGGVSPDFERDEYFARVVCLDHYDCPTVLRIVAREQLKAGDVSGALANVQRIPHGKDRVAAFQEVAAAQLEQGDREDALGTLQRAAETAWTLEDGYERFTKLLAVAVDMGRAGDPTGAGAIFVQAFELADNMPESSYVGWKREDYLVEVATAQAKAGDFDAALQTLRSANARMLVYAQTLREIATQQAKAGDATAAAAWARLEGDPMARAAALLGVAEGILERLEEEAKSDPSP